MPELTAAARRNVERGATSGAGTNVCSDCGGPKQESRINSRTCRDCGGSKAPRPGPSGDMERLLARLDKQAAAIKDLRRRVSKLEAQAHVSRNTPVSETSDTASNRK